MVHRAQLRCRRLILTHMSEDMLRRLGGIEAEWAEDGKSLTLYSRGYDVGHPPDTPFTAEAPYTLLVIVGARGVAGL